MERLWLWWLTVLLLSLWITLSDILNGSAVCVYRMEDVVRAFKGNFLHKEGPQYKWAEFTGKVPYPRPGTVSSLSKLSSLLFLFVCNVQKIPSGLVKFYLVLVTLNRSTDIFRRDQIFRQKTLIYKIFLVFISSFTSHIFHLFVS